MATLPELGAALCFIIIIVVLIAFFLIWMFFKFIIYFFPSIIVAVIVFLITSNLGLTAAAFVLSAILFAVWGYSRKRR
jgi:hypothetical protein